MQSPDVHDLLLHETEVALFRKRMCIEKPRVVLRAETEAQWTGRAARAVACMSASYVLTALCREFPLHLPEVQQAEGDRLRE